MEIEKVNKPKLVVFMASAMGYNEMRCLSHFESQYQIIFGSHNFVTPEEYLKLIDSLNE